MVYAFLTYDVKVAVLITVFYLFYRLLLSRETFHRVNRVVLLATAVLSFVLPLCVVTLHKTVVAPMPTVEIGEPTAVVADAEVSAPLWPTLLCALYIIGVLVVLGRVVMSVVSVLRLIRHSERHRQADGVTICVVDQPLPPFSWMHYIVMNRDDYAQHNAAVLAHERGHIRLRHSWDVLLVDFLTALQWPNPAMWMLRTDLRAIHEYEADGEVLSQGVDMRQYQYLLIMKAAGTGGYSIANGISHSTLKNRIRMMLHKESKRSHLLKLAALVPIVGCALALNAETVTDVVYQQPKQEVVKNGRQETAVEAAPINEVAVTEQTTAPAAEPTMPERESLQKDSVGVQEKSYDVVEVMPQFPGGPAAMLQYMAMNIRYPKEASDKNVEGRVIAGFVVEKDGSISDARVVKSVDPLLDAEALRVVNSMPNWTPGMQDGKPVRVKYTIPVTFRLQGATKPVVTNVKIGPEHKGRDFDVEIDGQTVDVAELNNVNPADIESMQVLKAKDGQPKDRLVLTMKKK